MTRHWADEEYEGDSLSVRWAHDLNGAVVLAVVKDGRVVASGGDSSPESVTLDDEDLIEA